jgi:oxygen-independent coproporphyrinogen-3 oxidase
MSQGIYISVPFCRTKCSFCNFASGVFSRGLFDRYVEQLCREIAAFEAIARELGGTFDSHVASIYLGGGTPSVLAPDQLERIFRAVRENFDVERSAEITVECAPGTIGDEILEALLRCGVNRVSLGVQSFVDKECSAVGRLHTRAVTLADIARLRAAGIGNVSIDLIAGLPHQTQESWDFSLAETLATGVPHVSVYMLEVDEDSRLGNELLAGGSRYHAHFVPDDDLTADLYLAACERLEKGGVQQYEISNFARPVTHGIGLHDSRHNLKYWTREPYLGFGVDAHSMLLAAPEWKKKGIQAIRFATPDSLEAYSAAANQLAAASAGNPVINLFEENQLATSGSSLVHFERHFGSGIPVNKVAVQAGASAPVFQSGGKSCVAAEARLQQLRESRTFIDAQAALEESFFLGLRLNRGVSVRELQAQFGDDAIDSYRPIIAELLELALLATKADRLCLTPRGRLLSNEVFARFLHDEVRAADV